MGKAEAQQRLAASGCNEFGLPHARRLWHIVENVLFEPMFLLLIAAGAICLPPGNHSSALCHTIVIERSSGLIKISVSLDSTRRCGENAAR